MRRRAHLRVSACENRLVSPCHRPPVSSLRPRISLVGRTVAPSQLQTAPTPRRRGHSEDQRAKQTSVLDFAIWDDMEVIFSVKRLLQGDQKRTQNARSKSVFPWSHNSVGHKVRSSRPSAGKLPTSLHARDDAPTCNRNHVQHRKKHHEQTLFKQYLKNVHMQRR